MFRTKKGRRKKLMDTPLPHEQLAIVERNVPYYRDLPPEDRRELEGLTQIFLAEKRFEGCNGLAVTDEIRVTIAALACMLLLHRKTDAYPLLQSVLVYPETFVAPVELHEPGGIVVEDEEEREGESWERGTLILSWKEVLNSVADPHDGYNVVFHEFAHQLDDEWGVADGAPPLRDKSMYKEWTRVFTAAYDALVEADDRDEETFLDPYGAENPAEFFAVVSECFFEMPIELREHHPELYEQLRLFYEQDPAARVGRSNSS
jgi:Mlc titration factor MtfA (ptsG expression regulator)